MKRKDKIIKWLEDSGYTTTDQMRYEKMVSDMTISITLRSKTIERFERCNKIKEGWSQTDYTYQEFFDKFINH